jgi:GntR family transcriptional regulator
MKQLMQFKVFPSSGVPIYRQLMDQIHTLIANGRMNEGDFIPSVREVAEKLQVNPMTVSKAYSLLERDGVLELARGQGMRVKAPHIKNSVKERQALIEPLAQQIVAKAYQLSLTRDQLDEVIKPLLKNLDRAKSDNSDKQTAS